MRILRSYLAFLFVGVSACGAAPEARSGADKLSVDRLYPLRAGSVWTYDVNTGQGLPVLAITRVLRSQHGKIEVSSGGEPVVYEARPDGLYRPDRAGFVLKAPIRKGAQWDAGGGARAEVVETDKQIATVAGEFTGCVEVVETGGAADKVVRTVFCPDVGPVEVESSVSLEISGAARVLAQLRGYDFTGVLAGPDGVAE